MPATPRHDASPATSDSSAEQGKLTPDDETRARFAELGRRGGEVRAARMRARKEAVAAELHLATMEERRRYITDLAGLLKAADLDEARRATAGAALVRALNDLDGLDEIRRERDALRTELATLRAFGTTGQQSYTTSLGDTPVTESGQPPSGVGPLDPRPGASK